MKKIHVYLFVPENQTKLTPTAQTFVLLEFTSLFVPHCHLVGGFNLLQLCLALSLDDSRTVGREATPRPPDGTLLPAPLHPSA